MGAVIVPPAADVTVLTLKRHMDVYNALIKANEMLAAEDATVWGLLFLQSERKVLGLTSDLPDMRRPTEPIRGRDL